MTGEHPLSWLRGYMRLVAEADLRSTDRLVAVAIATFADPVQGVCWPSDAQLSNLTGLAVRSHAAIRRRLIEAGLLKRIVYGHGRRNEYRIVLGSAAAIEDPFDPADNLTTPRSTQRAVVDEDTDDSALASATAARSAQRANSALVERERRDIEVHRRRDIRENGRQTAYEGVPMPPGFRDSLNLGLTEEKAVVLILKHFPGATLVEEAAEAC